MKTKSKFLRIISMFCMLLFTTALIAQNDTIRDWETDRGDRDEVVDMEKREKIIRDAEEAKNVISQMNPNAARLFDSAVGYAIFPNVGKGAYILGGAAGNGVVYENGERVGFAELRQLDIGLQIGGQAFREVIFFETQAALDRFKNGNLEFEGNASAVIIEEGKSRNISFQDGVAVVTMPKAGAMVELSIGGQQFSYGELD
ncbi:MULTISPECIES: lipid-binding SYLF domain-containing protein [Antarcticibacterium]|nr:MULTISPECIES: lipid-binding SYLF domain-containing protein [Antarcticibacterium]